MKRYFILYQEEKTKELKVQCVKCDKLEDLQFKSRLLIDTQKNNLLTFYTEDQFSNFMEGAIKQWNLK